MTEAITEPPEVTFKEDLLLYHVRKVFSDGEYETVLKVATEEEAREFAVQAFFNEIGNANRDWAYKVVERKKIYTTQVVMAL